jgi:hypothetical protein
MRQGRWRGLACWLLLLGLGGASGCMSCLHPIGQPGPECVEPCKSMPKCARDHVYVFLIHGMDPLDYANLTGLRDYLHELGFNKTYYGQLYHTAYFDREIHHIAQEDRDAHFVLIGFSFGANMVCSLAQSMNRDGIPVDLLVYMGGNTLKNCPEDQPENACRILNILACGAIWNGDTLERAENIKVPDRWHFGSPSHPKTLEALAHELVVVAAHVPVVLPPAPALPPEPEQAPTPRPVQRQPQKAERDEWDFLKPASRLGQTFAASPK